MTRYYSDGFLFISNPSPVGGGYTIMDENNNLIANERVMKNGLTNNEAELLGIYNALKIVQKGDVISSDSEITIKWIKRIKYILDNPKSKAFRKRARKDLDAIKLECYNLLISKEINLVWEPREKNLAGIYNEDCGIDNGIPDPDLI